MSNNNQTQSYSLLIINNSTGKQLLRRTIYSEQVLAILESQDCVTSRLASTGSAHLRNSLSRNLGLREIKTQFIATLKTWPERKYSAVVSELGVSNSTAYAWWKQAIKAGILSINSLKDLNKVVDSSRSEANSEHRS